ncbi:UDP-N-acetylglucosamine transferase subunit ALG14 [Pelagibacterium sediminicola]|uniref:UDP-N-acetylglucosamine transferase subunit ALG14 n=1 Tax=Pelagibacterium sediminicola TaxID=2248761 RepID=UPI001FE2793E|nr:UDP-N-acetylglucosamine transferase subunit ALG14 [Pelagibacterium sediminicola]
MTDVLDTRSCRILAVSSPGSRLAELCVIANGFGNAEVHFATSGSARRWGIASERFVGIVDFSLFQLWRMPVCAVQLAIAFIRLRPRVVISTGAAPGALALMLGRLTGARCIWVESLTSTDELSLSGRLAGRIAHLWLTQWEHLAREDGPYYHGGTL